jgi:hypothetical protein
MHHNLAGYSGTDGNAVHVHHNNFYDNALGFQTDIVTAAGHPGFPDDSDDVSHNNFYSNNFNPYDDHPPSETVEASFPFPVGTGMWIAGGNNHKIHDNRFWDNWRRGTMLFAVPDALVCGPDSGNAQKGCDPSQTHTSFRNRYYKNVMGVAPDGEKLPNGTDFWWDDFPNNTANCWFDNGTVTTSPSPLPDCNGGKDPETSVGNGDPANEGELVQCAAAYESGNYDPNSCPWFKTPPKPGSSASRSQNAALRARQARDFLDFCRDAGPTPTCKPFARLLR